MYDLRHTAITIMLEHPAVSEETVEAVAGHVSRKMKKVYSHVRLTNRRMAVSTLDGSPAVAHSDCTRLRPEGTLTNKDIIDMIVSDGLPPKIVVAMIRKAPASAFDTSRETLKELRTLGVTDSVIVAMVRAS